MIKRKINGILGCNDKCQCRKALDWHVENNSFDQYNLGLLKNNMIDWVHDVYCKGVPIKYRGANSQAYLSNDMVCGWAINNAKCDFVPFACNYSENSMSACINQYNAIKDLEYNTPTPWGTLGTPAPGSGGGTPAPGSGGTGTQQTKPNLLIPALIGAAILFLPFP